MTPPIQQQQPQQYTGQLSHPQKGKLHITFEGQTIKEVEQQAVQFLNGSGLIGIYYLNIHNTKTLRPTTIQITAI